MIEGIRFSQSEHDIVETASQAVLQAKAQYERQHENIKLIVETIAKLRGIDVTKDTYLLQLDPETKLYVLVKNEEVDEDTE